MLIRKFTSWPRRGRIVVLVVAGALIVALASSCAAVTVVPAAGAQAADWLRGIIGDEAVAQLENVVYQIQDDVQQVAYAVGIGRPSSPWQGTPVAAGQDAAAQDAAAQDAATQDAAAQDAAAQTAAETAAAPTDSTPLGPTDLPPTLSPLASPTPGGAPTATSDAAVTTTLASTPTPVAQPTWSVQPLKPMGTLPEEGKWLGYLQNATGQVVAYRTFLQPDKHRPYAVVAIVAFNLSATRLHLVLGTLEPASDVAIARPGTIPAEDLRAGKLLATFNGGFKVAHGHFGVMVNGTAVVPPRDGMATVAFYDDGHITLGEWDPAVLSSTHIITWRQNGPLVIQDGQINPHTADTAPQDWGYTVPGGTAIWRSGIGISADGGTLYYIAGPSLTLPVLATAMQDAGMQQAMQLDINNFWVHFDAIQGPGLQATPLLDKMNNKIGRYLLAYPRDFFYVTADGP